MLFHLTTNRFLIWPWARAHTFVGHMKWNRATAHAKVTRRILASTFASAKADWR